MDALAPLARHGRLGTDGRAQVVIVEEYLYDYRRRFFELLEAALAERSVRLTVVVGPVPEALAARRDSTQRPPFVREASTRALSLLGRTVTYKRVADLVRGSDLVVVDQALRHLENYELILRRRSGPKVAFWGHGARRVKSASALELFLERRLTKSVDWFFAYTRTGAAQAAASGLHPERITVVRNTVDVRELADQRDSITEDDRARLRAELDLPAHHVGLFIGALDESKRIPFLLEACSHVVRKVPSFVLVIAGAGNDRALVEKAARSSPWLRYVGRAAGIEKARLGSVSDVLLMPGRVGLVAVDSFALRTPIVTTTWPYHAPEADYLEDRVNALFAPDSVTGYADAVADLLTAPETLAALQSGCGESAPHYSLEGMVERFTDGVVSALAAPRA